MSSPTKVSAGLTSGVIKTADKASATGTSGSSQVGAVVQLNSSEKIPSQYLSTGVHLGGIAANNLLDDYEEGSSQVTVTDASGNAMSFYEQPGQYNRLFYTKVGNLVTFTIRLYSNGTSGMTSSSDLRITNMPFTSANRSPGGVWSSLVYDDLNLTSSLFDGGYMQDNSTILHFRKQDTDGTQSNLTVAEAGSWRVDLFGFYHTA